jgi:hypothetical protein
MMSNISSHMAMPLARFSDAPAPNATQFPPPEA